MPFDLKQLRSGLARTGLNYVEEVESTSTLALELSRSGQIATPTLILCQRQLAGRGQRGNTWWSSEDSLAMTWCWPTSQLPYSQGMLALAAGLAVEQGIIDRLGSAIELSIKWPNDLLANGKKIAGILVESASSPTSAQGQTTLAVGIGINVNQIDIPSQVGATSSIQPSSLRESLAGRPLINLTDLTLSIVASLEKLFIASPLPPAELTEIIDRKIFYKHQKICLERPNNDSVFGILQGIASDGGILIQTDLATESFYSGTLRPIGKS